MYLRTSSVWGQLAQRMDDESAWLTAKLFADYINSSRLNRLNGICLLATGRPGPYPRLVKLLCDWTLCDQMRSFR